jgi:hypothetical protein
VGFNISVAVAIGQRRTWDMIPSAIEQARDLKAKYADMLLWPELRAFPGMKAEIVEKIGELARIIKKGE